MVQLVQLTHYDSEQLRWGEVKCIQNFGVEANRKTVTEKPEESQGY
jgi:hypothetical protein